MRCLLLALATAIATSAAAHDIDPTRLPLGDGKISKEPKPGWIWACRVDPQAGGAHRAGPWIRSDGTWDSTRKVVVGGNVTWPSKWTIAREGDTRVFTSNGLPNHGTG